MKHRDKVCLARKKMRTKSEEWRGVPIFQSKAWEARRDAIAART